MSGKATRMPEVSGECSTTAAHSYREARSTVGTVPMLCPYRMMLSGLMPYLGAQTAVGQDQPRHQLCPPVTRWLLQDAK